MLLDKVVGCGTCYHGLLDSQLEVSPLNVTQKWSQISRAPIFLSIWIDLFDRFEVRCLTHPCTPFRLYRSLVDNNSINYCASGCSCVYYIVNENKISMLLFHFLTMLFFLFWMIPLMSGQKVSTGDYFCDTLFLP